MGIFKQMTYVKPVSLLKDDGWIVDKMNSLQNLFDDLKRYGVRIAIRNFFFIVLH